MEKRIISSSQAYITHAQACLLGQIAGDSLGSLVEFQSAAQIKAKYPQGVSLLENGGTWNTLAGQPTDDSEMALALAHELIQNREYQPDRARKAYIDWYHSGPFDCGSTIARGLTDTPDPESQANGALMRISPLGIYCAGLNPDTPLSDHEIRQFSHWAMQDARLTHPHIICQQINALYVLAIATAIRLKPTPAALYTMILDWAAHLEVQPAIFECLKKAQTQPPVDYLTLQGWVLIAFHNTIWQLLNAQSLEQAVSDTVMAGGDTDTNAAICGALMGAVYDLDNIPEQWRNAILNCRPAKGTPGVYQPRPELYWPVDALKIAENLISKE